MHRFELGLGFVIEHACRFERVVPLERTNRLFLRATALPRCQTIVPQVLEPVPHAVRSIERRQIGERKVPPELGLFLRLTKPEGEIGAQPTTRADGAEPLPPVRPPLCDPSDLEASSFARLVCSDSGAVSIANRQWTDGHDPGLVFMGEACRRLSILDSGAY